MREGHEKRADRGYSPMPLGTVTLIYSERPVSHLNLQVAIKYSAVVSVCCESTQLGTTSYAAFCLAFANFLRTGEFGSIRILLMASDTKLL